MKQQADILRDEKDTALKIAARAFARGFMKDLIPTVFGLLSDHGYFYDPVERGNFSRMQAMYFAFVISLPLLYSCVCMCVTDIETNCLPWLMDEVGAETSRDAATRCLLDTIIKEVVTQRLADYEKLDVAMPKAKPSEALLKLTKPPPTAQTLGQINLVLDSSF
jgi:hypothetical protein